MSFALRAPQKSGLSSRSNLKTLISQGLHLQEAKYEQNQKLSGSPQHHRPACHPSLFPWFSFRGLQGHYWSSKQIPQNTKYK